MKTIKNQDFKNNYLVLFYSKVQILVELRKKLHISQSEIARVTDVSLRKIQMFENYKSNDAYLLYCYKEILN